MHYLTRRFQFSASHRLHSEALDADCNQDIYGLCTNVHGHNYRLEITLRGEPDPRTGFFCNVMELHRVVQEKIVDPCEHQYLNELPLFQGVITTMENLAQVIWRTIEPDVQAWGIELHEVLLAETDDNLVRLRQD
ncbi:MAG: 6-carboxytetrahydropterin synthase [Planctomycetota bacterium]